MRISLVRQSGFTLIELVMVIVILGILSAVAIPKFVDLSGDAQAAATQALAGAITSGSVINVAVRRVNPAKGQVVSDCTHGARLIEGGLPAGYTLGGSLPLPVPAGTDVVCTLNGPNSSSASATLTGIL
ncbi:Fimbrial protein [Curvibacter sp. AEP1-3]|uniref:pilus assembly FimT family protein n=1 Tax=Curvibacter sp. AEP1-3 TaxID=1844971 RepID=UPI000B3CFF72|nr:type II secretion system protein [Curvibacter sp. AEP1-3]ARV20380.1 Fimbrial protein [Curvibacter sp. AEP1-3]